MKMLIIDNGGFTKLDSGKFSCHYQTGIFGVELKNYGNDVRYFQIYSQGNAYVNDCRVEEYGVKVSVVKRKQSKLLTYIVAYFKAVGCVIKTDFVYIFWPNSFKYLALVARLFGKKYGLYVRGQNDMSGKVSSNIFCHAFIIASVADNFTEYFKSMGIERAFTIKPMVNLTVGDIVSDRNYVVKKAYTLLFLGRVEADKGIVEMMEAFNVLRNDYNYDLQLNIVGNGKCVEFIRQFVTNNKLSDCVNLLGVQSDKEILRKVYISSDIYVLPTYHEGFPRTLYEAMTFGTPIATTFVGGIPSLMKDKENCRQIEAKSVESIVAVLKEMMDTYSACRTMVSNGSELMRRILSPDRLSHAQSVDYILRKQPTDYD